MYLLALNHSVYGKKGYIWFHRRLSLQLQTWSIFSRAVFPKLPIIKLKKLAVICAWSYFNAENLLSHVGGVPRFCPSKPISAVLILSRQHWPHFSSSVLFWWGIMCGSRLFPRTRDAWAIRMLVCGEAAWGMELGNTAQELLLPVKAIVLNLYGSDLPKVTRRFLSSAREIVIVKPGLWKTDSTEVEGPSSSAILKCQLSDYSHTVALLAGLLVKHLQFPKSVPMEFYQMFTQIISI